MPLTRALSTPFTLLVLGGVLCGMGAAACGTLPTSPVEQQRQFARGLEPESIATRPAERAPVRRTLRLRAYVDDRYAALNADERARNAVADAGAILAAQARIGLEIVDVRPWASQEPDVFAAVAELERRDKADGGGVDDDVDLVIGFIGPAPAFTDSLHLLGAARMLGRHLVARGMNDAVEIAAIDRLLSRMPDDERADLIARRARHKAAIVVLHEVAHALGGVHVSDPEAVLFPQYTLSQNRLNEDALALLEHGIAYHDARDDAGRGAAAEQLRAEIVKRRDRLERSDVDDTIALLEQTKAIAAGAFVLPPEQARAYNDAVAAWKRGDAATAFAGARELARANDAHPKCIVLACTLASAEGVVAMDGASLCERAVQRTSTIDGAIAALRLALKTKGDVARAFVVARDRANSATVDERIDVASLARATGRFAIVDEVLLGLEDARAVKLRDDVRVTRGRLGLPAGKLGIEEEVAFQAALSAAYDAMPDPKVAAALLDDGDKRFGELPGLLCARCEMLRRSRRIKDAEKTCARALELMPDASIAHVVAGLVDADKGRRAQAIERLEKALALDPEYAPTREILAKLRAR